MGDVEATRYRRRATHSHRRAWRRSEVVVPASTGVKALDQQCSTNPSGGCQPVVEGQHDGLATPQAASSSTCRVTSRRGAGAVPGFCQRRKGSRADAARRSARSSAAARRASVSAARAWPGRGGRRRNCRMVKGMPALMPGCRKPRKICIGRYLFDSTSCPRNGHIGAFCHKAGIL
jgi:hypothetical protein